MVGQEEGVKIYYEGQLLRTVSENEAREMVRTGLWRRFSPDTVVEN